LPEVEVEFVRLCEVPIVEVFREREEIARSYEQGARLGSRFGLLIGDRYLGGWSVKSFRKENVSDPKEISILAARLWLHGVIVA
jgi:hypothetical protein